MRPWESHLPSPVSDFSPVKWESSFPVGSVTQGEPSLYVSLSCSHVKPPVQGFWGTYFHLTNKGHCRHETLASEQMVTEGPSHQSRVITFSCRRCKRLAVLASRMRPHVPPPGAINHPLCSSTAQNSSALHKMHAMSKTNVS